MSPNLGLNHTSCTERLFRKSMYSRIIGLGADDERRLLEERKLQWLQNSKEPVPEEREKTAQEIEIIKGILQHMPAFCDRYGVIPLTITPEHIHFVEKTEEEMQQMYPTENGLVVTALQFIVIFPTHVRLKDAENVVHELIHTTAFNSITFSQGKVNLRRSGFEIHSRQGNIFYFSEINEAVTEELTRRFDDLYFHLIPELEEDVRVREVRRKELSDKGIDEKELVTCTTIQRLDGMWEHTDYRYAYREVRKQLAAIIDEIYERNKLNFATKEDVFMLFVKASLKGDLLPVARVIEGTYGKGSFRKLGEKTKKREVH